MKECEERGVRQIGEPRQVNLEFYISVISTKHPDNFKKIVKKYKDIRDGDQESKKPKIHMKKSLFAEFKEYKSKYSVIHILSLILQNFQSHFNFIWLD